MSKQFCGFCGHGDRVMVKGIDDIYICTECAKTIFDMSEEINEQLEENHTSDSLENLKYVKPSKLIEKLIRLS